MSPRASGSQCGEPRPVRAGTKNTPSVDSSEVASASVSPASSIRPSPSRSHWTAAPPTRTAPSSANCGGAPGATAAAVRSSPSRRRRRASRPDVDEHEAARPVRDLRVSRREAPLSEERRLLVARECPRSARSHRAALPRRRRRSRGRLAAAARARRRRARAARRPSRGASRPKSMRPRGVRHVGDVRRALRQLPDEPRVDVPNASSLAAARPYARGSTRASSRRSTGRGRAPSASRIRSRGSSCAALGRPAVLPDDRALHRPPRPRDPRPPSSRAGS